MSQHDGVVDNGSGATVRADLNNLAAALLTRNSGTTAPSTTYANMPWVDTTNHLVKERNEANSAWIIRGRTDAEALIAKTANYTIDLRDFGKLIDATGTWTLTLLAAATATDGFWFDLRNAGTGTITVDPNAAETIDGAATIAVGPGESARIRCNGTLWRTVGENRIAGLTEDASPDTANDYLRTYDASAGAPRKVKLSALATGLPRGHIAGLTLSNNGADATNDIDIAAGAARDGGNAADLVLAAAITKRLDAAWAVGTNQGGLDTGAIGNNTYHLWLIKRSDTGVVDVLFSLSAAAPTLPANYDYKRRIGSILRESAAIVGFVQNGDQFWRKTPIQSLSAVSITTTAANRTLNVPTGVIVEAIVEGWWASPGNGASIRIFDPALSDFALTISQGPGQTGANTNTGSIVGANWQTRAATNTTAQVRIVATGTGNLSLYTMGWSDGRGRFD